jgi:class 3 adenylate cyclase
MPRLQARNFAKPDDVIEYPTMHVATVGLDDAVVGHCRFEPGWRWSTDVGPHFGTASCPVRHLGYSVSGTVHVVMADGQTLDVGPDSVFDIPPGHDKWVVGDVPWEAIEWGASQEAFKAALQDAGPRTLGSVLFTDIVNSTARLQRMGDAAWRDLLRQHNARLRAALNIHRGREIKTTGDGILAVFDSPARAVRCAGEVCRTVRALGLEIRAGVHTGEIELVGDDVRGIAVHTAARVLALAGPSEVLVSAATASLLEGSGLEFEDAGRHELKGIAGSRQLFRLRADAATAAAAATTGTG